METEELRKYISEQMEVIRFITEYPKLICFQLCHKSYDSIKTYGKFFNSTILIVSFDMRSKGMVLFVVQYTYQGLDFLNSYVLSAASFYFIISFLFYI
jgi:hypothetical protein